MGVESALLQIMLAPGIGDRKLDRVIQRLNAADINLGDFVRDPDPETLERAGISPEVAQGIQNQRDEALRLWEELEQRDVRMLVKNRPGYPQKLNSTLDGKAPPALFALGNTEVLARKSVAFGGSRKASETGVRIAGDAAAECAKQEVNVISGYANGVDLAAHAGALEVGGVTTLVLAEGILNFRWKPSIEPWADSGKILVISEFPPQTRWFATNAMKRNATVCGLSDALVVVEAGLSGGTFDAAETALKLRVPLFVVDFANPSPAAEGNRYFLSRGAKPIRRSPDGSPNLTELWGRVVAETRVPVTTSQTSLGLG